MMKNDKISEANPGGNNSGFPVQLKLLLTVIILAIVTVILKAAGVF